MVTAGGNALSQNPVLRWAFRAPTYLFRWHLGWLADHRFLLLTHTGRRSGEQHHVVLEVVHRDPDRDTYVVVAGFGEGADWLRNVEANGRAQISVGRAQFAAVPRRLGEEEAADVLGSYEREHRLTRPVVHRMLRRLLGWNYDGSAESRLRAGRELPFVSFSPSAPRERGFD